MSNGLSASSLIRCFGVAIFLMLGACNDQRGALSLGSEAPSIRTKTLSDVGGDFSRVTSYRFPDERMYNVSLDEALKLGKPIVLEFATPGHCTVCDGQLQMLKGLLNVYGDDVLFLHMDQYQNPEAFNAFKVVGDPWTFVIDKDGTIKFRRAGRLLYNEIEYAIKGTLG